MCPPQLLLVSLSFVTVALVGSWVQGLSHAVPLDVPRVPLVAVLGRPLEEAQLELLLGGLQWVVCIGLCVIVVLPA
jgi:hypothetical protein